MRIIDISQPLRADMPVWPGDHPVTPAWTARIDHGSSVNVGAIAMSLHSGTHADAPLHVGTNGTSIERLSLDPFIGPAVVVEAMGTGPISVDEIDPFLKGEIRRILIKTREIRATIWEENFRHLSLDLVGYMADLGAVLVGVDTPSVDHPASKELAVHHALYERGIYNIENLDLSVVHPGEYFFAGVPIACSGMDAGPVRAVLIDGLVS